MITNIPITEAMWVEAEEYARKIQDVAERRGPNYTGIVEPERYLDGTIAELVFKKFMVLNGITDFIVFDTIMEDRISTDGGHDILVRGMYIDVKYVPEYGSNLVVNEKLRLRHLEDDLDHYVPVRITQSTGYVKKYSPRELINTAPLGDFGTGECRYIYLGALPRIEKIFHEPA